MGQIIQAEGVDVATLPQYPGTGTVTDALFFGQHPITGKGYGVPGARMPGAGGGATPTPTPSGSTAPQWVSGASYVAGALAYNQGIIYRAKQAIANSTTAPGSDAANWLAPPSGTGAGADSSVAAPVEYTVTVGQTSIGPNEVPALANATAIISITNAATDGHASPGFTERAKQSDPGPGFWFNTTTHTIEEPSGLLFDKAYKLSIKYATGVVGGGGGPSLTQVDLLDHTTDQMDEVMALSYDDNNDADPALSPAWGLPGMWFDGKDSNGDVWRYTCGRSTYTPGVPGSGVGPCWSRVTKIKP